MPPSPKVFETPTLVILISLSIKGRWKERRKEAMAIIFNTPLGSSAILIVGRYHSKGVIQEILMDYLDPYLDRLVGLGQVRKSLAS